jgi:hypothetical protein
VPTPMLVGLEGSMTVETAGILLPRVMRAMRVAEIRQSMHQRSVSMDGIGFADGPNPLRARMLMRVLLSDGNKDSLILHGGDPIALSIRVVGIPPLHGRTSLGTISRDVKHRDFDAMLDHGIRVTRWTRDALLTVIAGDALGADELVGAANAAAALARTAERYTQNGPSNTRMATPMNEAVAGPFLHAGGLQDGHHPLVAHNVPMSTIDLADGEIVLRPVYGEHHPSDDPLHRMRVHAHETAVMAHATRMGLLP